MEQKLTRYLVRRNPPDVFIWNEVLAKREDLEEVFAATPKEALERDALPDPRRISIEDLEKLSKQDLVIFAKVKMNMNLEQSLPRAALLDQVKEAIFTAPAEGDGGMNVPTTEAMDRPRARAI